MTSKTRYDPAILDILERIFETLRDKSAPVFPYDKKIRTIHLPFEIEAELRHLIATGNKIDAVKRVTKLTGAGLRVSKNYVDDLARKD